MFLSQVYSEYRASLAFDLVSSRQKNVRSSLFVSKHSFCNTNDIVPSSFMDVGYNQWLCLWVGLHRLQWLSCPEDGLHPSARGCFGKRGWPLTTQAPNFKNEPLPHELYQFSALLINFNQEFSSLFSAHPCANEFSEGPGCSFLHLRVAFLPWVSLKLVLNVVIIWYCSLSTTESLIPA